MELYICPVCGYQGLTEPAYDQYGYGSYEICVCCGFQFGYCDDPSVEAAIKSWRIEWIHCNYTWFSKRNCPPVNWNPNEQLKNIGFYQKS